MQILAINTQHVPGRHGDNFRVFDAAALTTGHASGCYGGRKRSMTWSISEQEPLEMSWNLGNWWELNAIYKSWRHKIGPKSSGHVSCTSVFANYDNDDEWRQFVPNIHHEHPHIECKPYIYIDNQNKVSATLVTCWHPSHGFCCGPVAIAGDHAPRGTIWPKVALLSAMREIAGNPPQRQATIVVTLHSEYHLGMAYTTHLW